LSGSASTALNWHKNSSTWPSGTKTRDYRGSLVHGLASAMGELVLARPHFEQVLPCITGATPPLIFQ
jgi:hypothetical protein